jgi:protein-tyrosine phosphatase
MTPQTVLFLCTGNYYRSRLAEIYFNHLAIQHRLPWQADSRGLRLTNENPGPISHATVHFLRDRGVVVPTDQRMPLAARVEDFKAAHKVVAVKEAEHRPLMELHFPEWVQQVEYWHIHDQDCATPRDALPALADLVEELVRRLKSQFPSQIAKSVAILPSSRK